MPETYTCSYCRDTHEDPEHHLTDEKRRVLDEQQIGPGGCPACRPQWASKAAVGYFYAVRERS